MSIAVSAMPQSRTDEARKSFHRLAAAFHAAATYGRHWCQGSEEAAAAWGIRILTLFRDPAFQEILADFEHEYGQAVQFPDFIPEQSETWDGMNLKRIAETFAGMWPTSARVASAAIRLGT